MSIGKRFRQDLGYYMLGVIVPGIISALTIPLLKKLLGASGFGIYGIKYNFMLLLVTFSVGWLCQSIIRFKFSVAGEEHLFYRRVFILGTQVVCGIGFLSMVVNLLYYHNSFFFSILFTSSFILCGFQNILIAVSQANFLSRFTMYSEAIRNGVFFLSAVSMLQIKALPPIEALFIALNISYLVSAYLLFWKNKLPEILSIKKSNKKSISFQTSQLFQYGLPLAVWYLINYLMLFLDKPALAKQLGYEVQGNYQALYELISKGALVLLIPVPYALFPLLSNAFENNDEATGMRLLKKVILIEVGVLVAGLIAYWLFGFAILEYILSIPDTMDYKWCGFFMLTSSIIWQIGMLVHKPFELRKQTKLLVRIITGALMVFLGLFFLIKDDASLGVYRFTLPFLGASITYVLICLLMMGHHKKMKGHIYNMRELIKEKLSV